MTEQKLSPYHNVDTSVFKYSLDSVTCYSYIKAIESLSQNKDVDIYSVFHEFNIKPSYIKKGKVSWFNVVTLKQASEIIDEYFESKKHYNTFKNYSQDELMFVILDFASGKGMSKIKEAVVLDLLYEKQMSNEKYFAPETVFKLLFLRDKYSAENLHMHLQLLNEKDEELPLNPYFHNQLLKDILFLLDVATLGDLKKIDINFVFTLFLIDYDVLIDVLINLEDDLREKIEKELLLLIGGLSANQRSWEIYKLRKGLDGSGREHTLEEIGEKYFLTRERVRQILVKLDKVISKKIQNLEMPFYSLLLRSKGILKKDDLSKALDSEEHFNYLVSFVKHFTNGDVSYDNVEEIFYFNNKLDDKKSSLFDNYPTHISPTQFNNLDSIEKIIVRSNYKQYANNFFIRKGISRSDMVLFVVGKLYPNGLRPSEKLCKKLNTFIQENFNFNANVSPRDLRAYMDRNDYCLINRGTFIRRDYARTIDEALANKIINYILSKESIVYYSDILEIFKTELLNLGIDNWYYVKGIIDPILPKTIKTKKDYCVKKEKLMSVSEYFETYIVEHNGIMEWCSFHKDNPGVKKYVFTNFYYSNDDKLLLFSNSTIIASNVFKLSNKTISELKAIIETLMISLKSECISANKLYGYLKITSNSILKEIPLVKNSFDMFSLVSFFLKGSFYFSRPFISKNKEILTYNSILRDYLLKQESFSHLSVASFCNRAHVKLYDYLALLLNMSDEFVQVSIDRAERKDVFRISDNQLDEIKKNISFYINSFGEINLLTFRGYSSLPQIGREWNQYLLAGIIRTYLNDDFDVDCTDSQYNLTSFIIRRKQHNE